MSREPARGAGQSGTNGRDGDEMTPPDQAMEELIQAAEDDETKRGLLQLERMDILEVTWDEETEGVKWSVTELGLDLCRNDEMEDYVRSAARPGLLEQSV